MCSTITYELHIHVARPCLFWAGILLFSTTQSVVTFVTLMAWKYFCWSQRAERGKELGTLFLLNPLWVSQLLCVCTPVLVIAEKTGGLGQKISF
jgi:hypothetical protein